MNDGEYVFLVATRLSKGVEGKQRWCELRPDAAAALVIKSRILRKQRPFRADDQFIVGIEAVIFILNYLRDLGQKVLHDALNAMLQRVLRGRAVATCPQHRQRHHARRAVEPQQLHIPRPVVPLAAPAHGAAP